MQRVPGAELFDGELHELLRERDRCAEQRSVLQELETERHALERALEEASSTLAPDLWTAVRAWISGAVRDGGRSDGELGAHLTRLRAIELDRDRVKVFLAARGDLDLRLARALARKHEQLVTTAPVHPVCLEIARAFESCAAVGRAVVELDNRTVLAEDTRDQVMMLAGMLDEDDSQGQVHKMVNLQPPELLLAAAHYSRAKNARELAERAARNFRALEADARATRAADLIVALDGNDWKTALLDGGRSRASIQQREKLPRRLSPAVLRCHERLQKLIAALKSQRRTLETLTFEHTQRYRALVLEA